MPVTMKDIAKMVGVSRPVVSAVLNNRNNSRVSSEKKKKIQRLVKELNFLPNRSALQLRGKPAKTIGILQNYFPSLIHNEITRTMADLLLKKGYQSYYAGISTQEHEKATIANLVSRGVDGIIISYFGSKIVQENYDIPIVSISENIEEFDIAVDLVHGGYIATKHLMEHGHKKIGFLTTHISTNLRKFTGYKKALAENGTSPGEKWMLQLTHNSDFEKELEHLIRKEKITAFCATNDYIAGKFMSYLFKKGYKVPEDIAVTGFDGLAFSEFTICPLTTVVQPLKALSENSVEILLKKISSGNYARTQPLFLKPSLHIGSSCGCNRDNLNFIYWEGTLPTLETLNSYIEPLPDKFKPEQEG